MIDQLEQQELNAKEYELLTKSVYEAILKTEGVTNVEVLHNQEVAGRFGGKHQIDVLWRFRQAAIEHTVLVECKNFSSNLEIAHVETFMRSLRTSGTPAASWLRVWAIRKARRNLQSATA
jgi:hypothetical protein